MDYNKAAPTTRLFFKYIQNKMHYTVHGHTAPELIVESRAKRHIPMTMEDWAKRIDAYLTSDEHPLLSDAGNASHEEAVAHAETEFEKYRTGQIIPK